MDLAYLSAASLFFLASAGLVRLSASLAGDRGAGR
ncbi:MAG: hypothetical protein JWO31_1947 [Phycisphaerales bacterium]|nr:hypothetical protein [Phycisphaerales bacterium]